MRIPPRFTAGDTVTWSEPTLLDGQGLPVTSTDYTLSFSFRGPAVLAAAGDVAGVAAGTGWAMTLPGSTTAAMNATNKGARWWWQAFATKAGQRLTVGSGQLVVDANFAALSGLVDGRSAAEQILAQIEATILARTTGGGVAEYTIGTRSMKYMAMTELLQLKSRYQMVVARERRRQAFKNGLGAPDRIGIRFK
jgi:hypothetical protein